ncbi:uncharacterized protein ACA1_231260 [Acanthamoeba castellanii str. Neff]|uniref:Uncharacterized protein n=1 Tax=Acanthamoeba castellanii (strain ATCC 30010 / Neff) TaxID=1257118 RepID=L8H856_ACACF|nr:uncharacterized protein ACA1_231260 [Acanthamoeba castellanii str. Neff]ELR21679.1 hypothetical protein ACA1_231260 [Acanthamoeba castellanii str. Neff]
MVKQSAVQAKVPIKNELNESQLNFFMNSSTSDKFQIQLLLCTSKADCMAIKWPLLIPDLSSIQEMNTLKAMSVFAHCSVPEIITALALTFDQLITTWKCQDNMEYFALLPLESMQPIKAVMDLSHLHLPSAVACGLNLNTWTSVTSSAMLKLDKDDHHHVLRCLMRAVPKCSFLYVVLLAKQKPFADIANPPVLVHGNGLVNNKQHQGALVVENWKQEAMKFVGTEGTWIVACPSTKALQEFINDPGSYIEDMHILIITYNALPQAWVCIPFFAQAIAKQLFLFSMCQVAQANLAVHVVWDELQNLKDGKTNCFQHAHHTIGLSGT